MVENRRAATPPVNDTRLHGQTFTPAAGCVVVRLTLRTDAAAQL